MSENVDLGTATQQIGGGLQITPTEFPADHATTQSEHTTQGIKTTESKASIEKWLTSKDTEETPRVSSFQRRQLGPELLDSQGNMRSGVASTSAKQASDTYSLYGSYGGLRSQINFPPPHHRSQLYPGDINNSASQLPITPPVA